VRLADAAVQSSGTLQHGGDERRWRQMRLREGEGRRRTTTLD
jgi:hypothetical protein